MNLYAYVSNNPINCVDPEGLVVKVDDRTGKGRGPAAFNVEAHLVVGIGMISYSCCEGKDLYEITIWKLCAGAALGASATGTTAPSKCSGISEGDFSIGPEAGVSLGPVSGEGALTFSEKGGASPSGGLGLGFGIKGKLTACTYKVVSKEKIGCCGD
jgi:hypothetical protein